MAVKTPAEIDEIFKNEIFSNMKKHFSSAIENAIMTLFKILKAREKETIKKLLTQKKSEQKSQETQTLELKSLHNKKTTREI